MSFPIALQARARTVAYLAVVAALVGCTEDATEGAPTGGTGGGGGTVQGSGGAQSGGAAGAASGGTSGTGTGSGGEGAGSEVPANAACAPVADWPEAWSALEEEALQQVNEVRASGTQCGAVDKAPAGPLTMDPHLRCAARLHSLDMAERDYFSHATWDEAGDVCATDDECPSGYICSPRFPGESPKRCGKGPALRVQEVGGPSGAGWENAAAGNGTAAATLEQWKSSTGHCNNLMDGDLVTTGIGYALGDGQYGHYWTQVFDD